MLALGRRAIASPDLSVFMQDTALLLTEMFEAELSAVIEPATEPGRLRMRLLRQEADHAQARVTEDDVPAAPDESLGGFVFDGGRAVLVDHLTEDGRFVDLALRRHGVQSAIAAPLPFDNRVQGVLASLRREAGAFTDADLTFLESVAHLTAATMARCHLEAELQAERTRSRSVMETVDALILQFDAQWYVAHMNQAGERITGYTPAEIRGRSVDTFFAVPEELALFQTLVHQLKDLSGPIEYESCLRTKDGRRRRIAWRCQTVPGTRTGTETILATGLDITRQVETAERLRQAEQEASDTGRRLAEVSSGRGNGSELIRTEAPIRQERRRRQRRSYPYRQQLAFVLDGKVPTHDDFVEIECNDIASGGFSFLSDHPPLSETVVIALGTRPTLTYLVAQVAHITRDKRGGRRRYIVGCSYSGRASIA